MWLLIYIVLTAADCVVGPINEVGPVEMGEWTPGIYKNPNNLAINNMFGVLENIGELDDEYFLIPKSVRFLEINVV